jgi:hypothetical protein
MTTRDKPGSEDRSDRPEGSQPTRKTKREDERIRKEGEAESSGGAPMDPPDEEFIESK